jgi:hypothetical protein
MIGVIKIYIKLFTVLFFLFNSTVFLFSQEKNNWWNDPVRLIQTNIPLDIVNQYSPEELLTQVKEFDANTWLLNMGGIYANYPSKLKYHPINPFLTKKPDYFGECLELAHQSNMRVIARFDFSRVAPEIHEKHPEWSFVKTNREALEYNGLYQTCINAPYYQTFSLNILKEALTEYPVDGVLINWYGNKPVNYYNGISNGTCKCNYCKIKWKEKYSRDIPDDFNDRDYLAFMKENVQDLLGRTNDIIQEIRPQASFSIFHKTDAHGIVNTVTTEARTDFNDPQTWWPYEASFSVNEELNAYPNQVPFNTVVNFVHFQYRFASHRPGELTTRIYQNIANGGPVAFYMVGAPYQLNQGALSEVKKVYTWHKRHESIYDKTVNAAEVLVIKDENFKGVVRLLSEEHIPYKVVHSLDGINPETHPLCVATNGSISGLENYLQKGGNLLLSGMNPPKIDSFQASIKKWSKSELSSSYWVQSDLENNRVKNLYFEGPLLQFEDDGTSDIKLRLPSVHSPAEIVETSPKITNIPGVFKSTLGKGNLIYFPWNITAHYFKHSTLGYKHLFASYLDTLLKDRRQLYTDASGLVEFTVLKNKEKGELLLNLINLTPILPASNSQAIPFQNINIRIKGAYKTIELVSSKKNIEYSFDGNYTRIVLKQLNDFETIVLK